MADIDFSIYESMVRVLKACGQLEQLTESFCVNNSTRISELKLAVANKDVASASAIAHVLKGSCSMFGAKSCVELCKKIESILEKADAQNNFSEFLILIPRLESELEAVVKFIRQQSNYEKPECCP